MAKPKPVVQPTPIVEAPEKSVLQTVVDNVVAGVDHILHPQPTEQKVVESKDQSTLKKFDKFKKPGDHLND